MLWNVEYPKFLLPHLFPFSDACRLALGADAVMNWRTLSEHSELVRPPEVGVRPIKCGQAGRQWFWVLLLHNKGCGLRDAPCNKLGRRDEPRHVSEIHTLFTHRSHTISFHPYPALSLKGEGHLNFR